MFLPLIFTNLGDSLTFFRRSLSLKRLLLLSSNYNCRKFHVDDIPTWNNINIGDYDCYEEQKIDTNIPIDILQQCILRDLEIDDRIRLASVNKYWRSIVIHEDVPKCPHQFPWLMLPFKRNCKDTSFYDLNTGKIHKFDLPAQLFGCQFCATSKGWIVVAKDSYVLSTSNLSVKRKWRLYLFNPISHEAYELPCLSSIPDYISHDEISKIELSSSNISKCVIGGIFGEHNQVLGFCKVGDTKWITYAIEDLDSSFHELMYMDGAFNVIINTKNSTDHLPIHQISLPSFDHDQVNLVLIPSYMEISLMCDSHLVESIDGKMLMILEKREVLPIESLEENENGEVCEYSYFKKKNFEVFVVDLRNSSGSQGCFKRLESVGEQVIFIGSDSSGCVCSTIDNGSRDCIYFLDRNFHFENHDTEFSTREHGVFNLANGRFVRSIPCLNLPNKSLRSWFTPTINV